MADYRCQKTKRLGCPEKILARLRKRKSVFFKPRERHLKAMPHALLNQVIAQNTETPREAVRGFDPCGPEPES
jgi:hypothetical protein